MTLRLHRTERKESGVFGELLDSSGKRLCLTLEHSYHLVPKIPAGVYTCVRGMHSLHVGQPFVTFEITGVPGHSGLLFHRGNQGDDSKGCVLLGQDRVGDFLERSALAFNSFMALLEGQDTFNLIVS